MNEKHFKIFIEREKEKEIKYFIGTCVVRAMSEENADKRRRAHAGRQHQYGLIILAHHRVRISAVVKHVDQRCHHQKLRQGQLQCSALRISSL